MALRPPGPKGYLTEEEKSSAPKITKALILRILSYLRPYWWQFLLVFLTVLVSSVLGLLPSIITGRIVDEALIGQNMRLLIELLVLAFITLIAAQVIGVLESYINAWISERIVYDMKNQMYKHLQCMPHSFFTSEKQGDIITRMNSDVDGVAAVISGTLSSAVSNSTIVITTLVALFSMNWQLAIVGIIVIPLLILPTKEAGKTRYQLLSAEQAKHDEMNEIVRETLSVSGSLLSKLFTREKVDYDRFERINAEVTKIALREQRSGKWFRLLMGMFMQIGPLLIYFAGGYFMVSKLDPALTVGTVTATVSLINRLYRPVQTLFNLQVDFTRSLALFARIFEYLDRINPIRSLVNARKPDLQDAGICFSHVHFSYSPEVEILKDVSFTIPGGKMYAIVGPSGSGKSTVVNLIPRLYDVTGGQVRINGIDVRNYDLTYLRQSIGVVTQDAYLFNGTILDNLVCARDGLTQDEIDEACRAANIDHFISTQPNGYQTVVGNRGLKLSGGEKQRISLARVILKNPKILILDEATSALDSISENAIQNALDHMMLGRTSIVIAHRLSTVLAADEILVIAGGIIAEQGTHAQLLQSDGIYRRLYETQFARVLENQES
ncbi:MAG: ABC transporter ATP-binding protein [Clostridia bacterium]